MKNISFSYRTILFFAAAFLLTGCGQVSSATLQEMLINLSSSYPALWRLATGAAYLFGVSFMMRGVYALKVYGDMRTMMSSSASIKAPLILLITGSALMFFPTMKSVLLQTAFGYGDQLPISYSNTSSLVDPQAMYAMLGLIQLIGVISFIRGWIILSHSANPSGQSQFGKGLTHIVGGLFAINIQGTVNMLQATFGLGG